MLLSRTGPNSRRPEFLLFIASVCVVPAAVLAAEGGLALLGTGRATVASASIDGLHRYSEALGWEPRPGRYDDYGRPITINAAGYRGENLASAATGRRRIVVLGDSIAFGLYVGDDETYAARLAARSPDSEVANLAVQGYGPGQSLLRLERLGLGLKPDVVLLALCLGNDFADAMLPSFLYDEAHPTPYYRREQGRLVRYDQHLRLGVGRRLSYWLLDNSRLFRAVAVRPASQRKATKADGPWTRRRAEAMSDRGRAVDLVATLVAQVRDTAEADGARFLAVLHPDRVAGERQATTWEGALTARLQAAGVESLSLARAYADRGLDYGDVAIDSIGHLSPAGHDVTAEIILERLTGTGSRPPR